MAKKQAARKPRSVSKTSPRKRTRTSGRSSRSSTRTTAGRTRSKAIDPLLEPLDGAAKRTIGRVQLEVVRAGDARVKRMIYPAGFRWSIDMRPVTGTTLCMHAHVGFLARGRIQIAYPDGCIVEYTAPQVVAIEPGHDGWVVGNQPAVLIEFDFERDTLDRLGMPAQHRH
jgi:hypothetical protein